METQQFSNGPWCVFDDDAETVVRDRDLVVSHPVQIEDERPPPTQRCIEATPSGPSRAFTRTVMGPGVQNFEAEHPKANRIHLRGSAIVDEPSPVPWVDEQPSPVPWIAKSEPTSPNGLPLPFRDGPKATRSKEVVAVATKPAARVSTPGLPVAPVPAAVAAPPRAEVIPAAPSRPVVIRTPSNRPPPPANATPAAMAIDLPTGVRERASRDLMGGPPSLARRGNKASVMLAAASLVITLLMGFVLLTPRSGQLRIAPVVDKGKLERADVFVDGTKRCDAVPCVVSGLSKGEHGVEIRASGYNTEARIQSVAIGKERLALIPIHPVSTTAGFHASAPVAGVHAFVDGADRGVLPLDLVDLKPGEHLIRFAGPGFEGAPQAVNLAAGEVKDFGVVKAAASSSPATDSLRGPSGSDATDSLRGPSTQ